VEIPDFGYYRETLSLFGPLLLAVGAGLGLGYLAASLFRLPISETILGFVLGAVGLTGSRLFVLHKKRRKSHLYPVIKDIIKKG
jgi:hypothetical protein